MELRHQISVLRAWSWLLIASLLLASGAAYLVSINLPKVYEGKVTLIVGQSTQSANPDLNQLLASQRLSQTYTLIATSGPLLEQVIAKNGLGISPGEFKSWIVADAPIEESQVLAEGGLEQLHLLCHQTHAAAQIGQGHVSHIYVAQANNTGGRIV